MPPIRSQRSGATLDEVRAGVLAEFGPGARIVSAERVTTGGVAGLFRKAHVEAVIEVPDPLDPPTARVAIASSPAKRAGIAALLADAEAAESRIADSDGTATVRADAFASVLDGFAADGLAPPRRAATRPAAVEPGLPSATDGAVPSVTSLPGGPDTDPWADLRAPSTTGVPSAPAPAPAPAVRSADGDLVLLVGRATDVDAAAGVFASRHGLRATAASDRRSGILARADAVRDGVALLAVAAWTDVATTTSLAPDQVWVVVDVGRKHEDAVTMLSAVVEVGVPIAGILAIGAEETSTPETVRLLGVPVRTL
ncbi:MULTISPECIES: hypothetical protein [unclassified Curtobacterium]|uniref:hypothetical protein n=1 Tax=unclassified Curtobacterium TaxID=257496 RepID=UPI000DA89D02|nr:MULTISPECIES: hypothetical protein [unclassified Curtobacterium]PZE39411.1 hypothetical protein DEJ31_00745 [Curtobacterium sp. MCPF17_031]PZF13435.1 hypothetical protein DEJ25_06650 [Curtobacterium sp. MCPF17_011]